MSKTTEFQVEVNGELQDTFDNLKDAGENAVYYGGEGDNVEIIKVVTSKVKAGTIKSPTSFIEWK